MAPLNEGRGVDLGDASGRFASHDTRSTKAGALTPATPVCIGLRHELATYGFVKLIWPSAETITAKSLQAGALTPATPPATGFSTGWSRPLNEGRGVDPGDTGSDSVDSFRFGSLNEGRGVDPGDTSSRLISDTPD